jgi:glycine/D-amino acid oxidase-like deaminating enzyme
LEHDQRVGDNFSFVIVGGGILGCAVASLASAAGYRPLVLRLSDTHAPRADTLRNQGWLQSGVMYPIARFADEKAYVAYANRTFFAGREMLENCGLQVPEPSGIVGVDRGPRLSDLLRKRELLRISEHEFARIHDDDAEKMLGRYYEAGLTYFLVPDAPFDEAAILSRYRGDAIVEGAVFVEVTAPVRLSIRDGRGVVSFDGQEVESATVVVAAGAGSFELMRQCGAPLPGSLHRTPLLVGDAPQDMRGAILVDLARGFSVVRHDQADGPMLVMGTRHKTRSAPDPVERAVTALDRDEFAKALPSSFQTMLEAGRFTAGYEVIPDTETLVTPYEPWIREHGPIVFGSPGRATVGAMAAKLVLAKVIARGRADRRRTSTIDLSACNGWERPISMHFNRDYSFNDAKG